MKKFLTLCFVASFAFLAGCSTTELPPVGPPVTPDQPEEPDQPDQPEEPDTPVIDEKYEILGDNLYYNEIQLGASKTLWVQPKELKEGSKAEGIVWYVNDAKVGTGVSYTFTPTKEGAYAIKYKIASENSTTDKEQSKLFNMVVYKMDGIFILEESNMSAAESCRGVSQHKFGTTTVEDYIKGDFTSFGLTEHYFQNWAKNLYNLSGLTTQGVALSKFSTGNAPKMLASVASFDAPVKTFSGVNEEIGIITTTSAHILDLKTLAVKGKLKGSEGATNTLVADGYAFVITTEGAKAYKVDGLSATTEPKLLGAATIGFVQSKDGSVWAFNKTELLRINTSDLSTTVIPLPAGVEAKNSKNPWKQFSLAASEKENAIFWVNDNGWATGKEVYKYMTDTNTLLKDFIVIPDGPMLYGPSILYNAEADQLICITLKGYGPDFSSSTLHFFNASTAAKLNEVAFSTDEGGKSVWANAMLAPIKNY